MLLDDAARPGERIVAQRWRHNWPDFRFTLLPGAVPLRFISIPTDPSRLFVQLFDGRQQHAYLGIVLDQLEFPAIGKPAQEDDHVRAPIGDVLDVEGVVAGAFDETAAQLMIRIELFFELHDLAHDALVHPGRRIVGRLAGGRLDNTLLHLAVLRFDWRQGGSGDLGGRRAVLLFLFRLAHVEKN